MSFFNDRTQRTNQQSSDPVSAEQLQETANPNSVSTNVNNINWLGSSYTGADIKVVAHLYTDAGLTPSDEQVRMQQELQETTAAATACQLAAQSLPSSIFDIERFFGQDSAVAIANLGGVQPDSPAGRLIISIFRSVPRTNGWAQMRSSLLQAYSSQAVNFQMISENLENKIRTIDDIRKNSTQTLVLGNLQTISVQTFRTKQAVRALGHSYVKGYTRGIRTIAGSMIFTLFNEHSLSRLTRSMSANGAIYGEMNNDLSTYIADQLPPFDATIVFANEYGSLSQMTIYGIEFISDGQTMSIEDLLTEQVLQFVARDIDIMTDKGRVPLSRAQRGMHVLPTGEIADKAASSLQFTNKDSYADYLQKLGIRTRRTQF
jgi:hypothetical protein